MSLELPQDSIVGLDDSILVTGSNGFIGTRVVASLLQLGFRRVRCFVRPSGRLDGLQQAAGDAFPSLDLVTGNLLSSEDCRRAAEGVEVVLHLAAGMEKSFASAFMNSVLTTRNLIEATLATGRLRHFVNVSSFAVYSNLRMKRHALVDESSPLEDCFQERSDAYGFGKLKQEELVRRYGREQGLSYVILRPGVVYAGSSKSLTGRVGIDTFGLFLHLGGRNRIPLTHVDNCAAAIVLAGLTPGLEGEVFNVVDDDHPTSRGYLKAYKKKHGHFFSLPLPYPVTYALCAAWERYSQWSQGQLPPAFNRRRCAAEWKGNRYSNARLKEKLGWQPHPLFQQSFSTRESTR